MKSVFHFAYHVRDLDEARRFYTEVLKCSEGRSTDTWVDMDFFGHQLSLHLGEPFPVTCTGHVGEHKVPLPHLGVVLEMPEWEALAEHLKACNVDFVFPPMRRFVGEPGEQSTMFLTDPFGNPIEIKGFANWDKVFEH